MESGNILVLAGDIGGTKTNLGIYRNTEPRPTLIRADAFSSVQAVSLSQLINAFLLPDERKRIVAACFGVAGPVLRGHSKITNLAWEVSEQEIMSNFGFAQVRLINDLMAIGYGVQVLTDDEILVLNEGEFEPTGMRGLVAPGTGLGISLITPLNDRLRPWPSEGGHADFAPKNDREMDLWRYIRQRKDHVSIERVVSGPGILRIFKWLSTTGAYKIPAWLEEDMKLHDPSAVITQAAIHKNEPICQEALDMFVSILGSIAGNVALMAMTTGGMYIGGGIPPKILPRLEHAVFMNSFLDKGRFREILRRIPVKLILNDKLGEIGAAVCAIEALM